jgi:hypothetical protein
MPLADDLDSLAFLQTQLCESLPAHASDPATRIAGPRICDLKAYDLPIICHCCVPIVQVAVSCSVFAEDSGIWVVDLTAEGMTPPMKAKVKRDMGGFVAGGAIFDS